MGYSSFMYWQVNNVSFTPLFTIVSFPDTLIFTLQQHNTSTGISKHLWPADIRGSHGSVLEEQNVDYIPSITISKVHFILSYKIVPGNSGTFTKVLFYASWQSNFCLNCSSEVLILRLHQLHSLFHFSNWPNWSYLFLSTQDTAAPLCSL